MEQFIELVKQFPILWNTQSKDYHNINKKDGAWKTIVEELKNPDIPNIKSAKNEWKKLRDGHRESIKRMKSGSTGQAATATLNNWKYAEFLEFLLPYMKNRKRTGNVSITESETENIPGTSSTENVPGTSSTENLIDEIVGETEGASETLENLAGQVTRRKRKATDDSTLRELLKDIDNDFMVRCEQRDKRKAELADEAKKNKHPLNLFFESICESTKKLPSWLQRDVKQKVFKILCEAEQSNEMYMSTHTSTYGYSTESTHSTPLSQNEDSFENL